jgi:hypothetical protein
VSTPPVIPPTPDILSAPTVAGEPTALRAGDSWQWTRNFEAYPSGQGWALQYVLNSPSAIFQFPAGSITVDADSQSFDIAVTPAQTAAVTPGTYDLYSVLSLTQNGTLTDQQTFLLQSCRVDAKLFGASAPIDTRSFVKKTLDMLEAAISGDQSPMVQEYEVSGRRISYMNKTELDKRRDEYAYKYDEERAARGEFTRRRKVLFTMRPNY